MMSEPTEYTSLLENPPDEGDQTYVNMGYNDGRRPSNASSVVGYEDASRNVDELLCRIQYAFLNPQYDVVADVRTVIQACSLTDIDRILETINSTPLTIHQKLKISRLLRSEGNLQAKYRTGKSGQFEKRGDVGGVLQTFQLWEGTITKLAAYFGSNVASYFSFVRTLVYINLSMALILVGFITVPEMVDGNFKSNLTYGGHFGELSDSIMFYGLYTDTLSFRYNLSLAYLLTWMVVNLFCFIFIITIMTLRYRRSKLSEDQSSEYKFAWRMFCTWDYSITSRQGVLDHRTSLRTDLKELVREERATIKVEPCTRCLHYFIRVVCNLVVIAVLVGSGYLIYYVANNDILSSAAPEGWKDLFVKYQLTSVVAGLKFLVPPLFQQLVRLESWHPRIETKITLARTTLFYIASLLVFVASLYEVTDDCVENVLQNSTDLCCWENEVGEEVFKVILLDMGILVAVGILLHGTRAALAKCCSSKVGYSKFDVVSCVLDVIYGQALIWLGLYFSPLLAVLGVIKLVAVFYFRLIIAKVAMVPPQQLFRASSTGNFYLTILLLNLFISLFPMAYGVIEFQPSPECGPFSKFDRSYHVISSLVGDLPDWLEDIVVYLGTPAIMVPILIFLIMVAIFFKVKSSSYRRLIKELRNQLIFERRVEKRKIFATGRAMSGGALSRYTSQESLVSNTPQLGTRQRHQRPPDDIIEEEHDM